MNASSGGCNLILAALLTVAHPLMSLAEQSLQNSLHRIIYSPGSGLALSDPRTERVYFSGAWADGTGEARQVAVEHPTFGRGQALEVPGTNKLYRAMLFENLPFVLLQTRLANPLSHPQVVREETVLSGTVRLGHPASALKSFGTGGLLPIAKNPGSYAWLGIVDPATRRGVVFGFVTQDRGSGVLFSSEAQDSVKLRAEIEYGRLRLAAGQQEDLELLAVGCFDDARLGLESYASLVGRHYQVKLPAQPAGYCTWYSRPHGGASDQEHLAELAAFAATNLAPYGFSVVQIDDKWQDGVSTNGPRRLFTRHAPKGPYPDGMKAAADKIKSLGLVPGLWFMPFAGTYYDPFFADKQAWFVKREDGGPYETSWGGTCLDMTHPQAREYLRQLVHRIAHDWGYEYFKLDGLWTGTATRQQYVNSGYKDDGMGDAVFFDPDKTNLEAYRDGLKLVRQASGPKVFILGCNGPQNMRSYGGAFGLVDAMRIGPDNGSEWQRLIRGPQFGSRHYFLHGRVWMNDPDPVYVRPSMPLEHARLICSWVAISGQLNLSSEWLPGLPPERLDLLKRTMASHGLLPRPVDLFDEDLPGLWLLADTRRPVRRDVVAVYNWSGEPRQFDVSLERLGLITHQAYAAFDYWDNQLLEPIRGRLQMQVPPQSCRIIAVRPLSSQPQIISTSAHVTQGMLDVLEEQWDAERKELRVVSRVLPGDACEVRIPTTMKPVAVRLSEPDQAAGVGHQVEYTNRLVRVTLRAPTAREVRWSVVFE